MFEFTSRITIYDIKSIPTRIFKHFSDLICVPFSKLINESFTSEIFPNSLKIASVIPIFKTGDRKNIEQLQTHLNITSNK